MENAPQLPLFDDADAPAPVIRSRSKSEIFEDYDAFVKKFEPKKTTDDCYTPEHIYRAVTDWVSEHIMPLEGVEIVRPFWPGGDYETHDYPEGCVVIDNPPFSILAKIRRFYHAHGIRYFLFAPALTLVNSAKELPATFIVCGATVTYANGAGICTSFVTNLDCGGTEIWVAGTLLKAIEKAEADFKKTQPTKRPPKYVYPMEVCSPAILQKIAARGVELKIDARACMRIGRIDASDKGIFGGGWLISERAAAERAAAERAAAERAAAERAAAEDVTVWELSERERRIVKRLGKDTG